MNHPNMTTEVPEGYEKVTDVETLGAMVIAWHTQAMHRAMVMANIDDSVAVFQTDPATGEEVRFTPEQVEAYRQGIMYACEGFEKLPFNVTHVPEPEESAP